MTDDIRERYEEEHLMRIEPIAGQAVEAIVAGMNSGAHEIRGDSEGIIEVASKAEIAQIWSIEETAAAAERIEFTTASHCNRSRCCGRTTGYGHPAA